MEQDFKKTEIATWKRSIWLNNAFITFARPHLKKEWERLRKQSAVQNAADFTKTQQHLEDDPVSKAQGALEAAGNVLSARAEVLTKMKADLVSWASSGRIFGFGFESPRRISSVPLIIPKRFWKGRILWDKNCIDLEGIRIEQVRLLPYKAAHEIGAFGDASRSPGRPSTRDALIKCFDDLANEGRFYPNKSFAWHFPLIRDWLSKHYPNLTPKPQDISDKTIRNHLSHKFRGLSE